MQFGYTLENRELIIKYNNILNKAYFNKPPKFLYEELVSRVEVFKYYYLS